MHKLAPVEEAKTLFREARDWSVWRWLLEKRRARSTADAAWAALAACEEKVKAGWAGEWQQAYRDLSADGRRKARRGAPRDAGLDPEVKEALARLHEADVEASQAHEAAEAQFDEADRRMSSSMACEGAQMAIDAWEMREKVIRKAEALGRRK
jgi:hypothetical protein